MALLDDLGATQRAKYYLLFGNPVSVAPRVATVTPLRLVGCNISQPSHT